MSKAAKQGTKAPTAQARAAAPGGRRALGNALSWGLMALGGVALVKGQWDLHQDHFQPGLAASLFGALLLGAGFVLPLVPWHRLGDLAAEMKALIPSLRRAPLAPKPAGRSPLRGPAVPEAAEPKLPWRPFAEDRLVLSRHWLALPLALLAFHANLSVIRGSIVMAVGDIVVLMMGAWVYFSNFNRSLVLPHLNDNFKTLGMLLLPVILLEIPGVWVLYQYVHVMTGYLLVLLGGAWMLAILARRPLNLVDDEAGCSRDERWYPARPFFTIQDWAVKCGLLAGAAVCAFLSIEIFSGKQPGLEVSFGFLGMGLLLMSFPLLPDGLASWQAVPAKLRALLSLGMALTAFLLGVRAQAFFDAGSTDSGLWCALGAGILLVLGLGHYGSRAGSDGTPQTESGAWARRVEIAAVFLLVFAAIQFRIYKLNTFPFGAEGDEAGGGVWASQALAGQVDNPIVSANFPLHFVSITALFFKFFGVQVWTMRAHAAFFGVISVLTAYFFLRFFFGAAVSFLVTALMSCSYWHLHYSRFGHYNIEQVALQMAAFYFVFKGMRSGKAWAWIMGGLAFGLALQPHLASRLLPFEGIALLVYFLLARRDLLRRHLSGFLIFVVASWMMAAPAVTYWLSRPISMGRVQSVSIFDKTNSNAPVDVLQGFVKNCKISIMMFNQFSDSRTRDNPLAPQKILENWSAILFLLAFVYLLYHWRDSVAFLLLSAFFINLSASVFSVEAPQTLRTAGNMPLVFAFMGFLLYDVRGSFRLLGKRAGNLLFLLIFLPSVGFFCYRSWQKYFVEARNLTFDAVPTYVAQVAGEKGTAKDQAVFFATGFASSHPPVMLFAQNTPIRNFYNVSDYLPISLAADKTHLLFFCDSFEALTPWAHSLYPQAQVVPIPHLTAPGEDLASYMIVSKEEIASHQGLSALVDGKLKVGHAALEYPSAEIPSARHIHWSGSLRIERYGFYTFSPSGAGDCSLRLAGQLAYSRQGGQVLAPRLRLPMGVLPIQLDYAPRSSQPFRLNWTGWPHPAHLLYSLQALSSGEIEKRQLLDFPVQGLYGQYYTSKDFKGDSVMEYVEPTVLAHWLDSPLPGNWCAVWRGRLRAPVSGTYHFAVDTFGSFTELRVDGRLVQRGGSPPEPEMKAPHIETLPVLAAGEHNIEVRFFTTGPSWYEMRWSIPGQAEQLLLPEYLSPTYPHF
jgi:hypothetical protein